mmetsp:Transcript_13535/g.22305  ORF Transcript_13535/g.22305 Transcript_13535/m.22305 type:complete len:86 (-) Transcript_13535:1838-2095(-)
MAGAANCGWQNPGIFATGSVDALKVGMPAGRGSACPERGCGACGTIGAVFKATGLARGGCALDGMLLGRGGVFLTQKVIGLLPAA